MGVLKFIGVLAILTAAFGVVFAIWVVAVLSGSELPSPQALENPKQNLATRVYSADGKLLDHFYVQRRINLKIDEIPTDFINALIATEDKNFYSHWGVSIERFAKAIVKNIMAGEIREGGSTITMQLARKLFKYDENTAQRKIREMYTAFQIERTFTKEEILEMYANAVPFGRGAYGVQVASQVYFNKPVGELTASECAFLVGLLKAPEHYNGIVDYERSIKRRNLVLRLMKEQGYIPENRFTECLMQPLNLEFGKPRESSYYTSPHFVETVRQKLRDADQYTDEDFDLYRDGLVIYTTIDSRIQKYANEAVSEHMTVLQRLFDKKWKWSSNRNLLSSIVTWSIKHRADYSEASREERREIMSRLKSTKKYVDSIKNTLSTIQTGLVVINPEDGAVLAMVGASPKFMKENPYAKYSLNHATQSKRQPGSSFKPLIYSLALQNGMTPWDEIECGPFSYKTVTGEVWSPRGAGKCEKGETSTLYRALTMSINTVAARLVTSVTSPEEVVELARKMGIKSRLKEVPAIALGAGGEVTLLELVSAFGVFPMKGYHVEPNFITRIEDRFGNALYEDKGRRTVTDALDEYICDQITMMLKNVINAGTGWPVKEYFSGVEAAGKTGTTNDNADAWFVGYTPEIVAGVWVGFDNMKINFDCLGSQGYGGRAAGPIWGRLIGKIYSDPMIPYRKRNFEFVTVDSTDSLYRQTYFTQPSNTRSFFNPFKKKKEIEAENSETERMGGSPLPKLPKPPNIN